VKIGKIRDGQKKKKGMKDDPGSFEDKRTKTRLGGQPWVVIGKSNKKRQMCPSKNKQRRLQGGSNLEKSEKEVVRRVAGGGGEGTKNGHR